MKIERLYYIALYWTQTFCLFFPLLLELLTSQSWQRDCLIAQDFFLKSNVRKAFFPRAMLTQVSIEWLTAKMPFLYTNVAGKGVPKKIDYLCFKKGWGGGRCLQGNLWYSPLASITSRFASVTFKMASKVFIEETDKNFDLIKEILFRFLGFGDFKVPIVIEN